MHSVFVAYSWIFVCFSFLLNNSDTRYRILPFLMHLKTRPSEAPDYKLQLIFHADHE